MKKSLLFIAAMMVAALSHAQGVWNDEVSANAWTYSFSAGTSGTFNTAGADTNPAVVTDPVTVPFLPAASSGTARVSIPASSGASFVLNKTTNVLELRSTATGSTKFSVYTTNNATEIASMSFTATFEKTGVTAPANNTAFVWSMGYRGLDNTLYSNNNAVFTSTNSGGDLFNAIRFLYNSTNSNYAVGYRTTGTSTAGNYATLNGGALSPDVAYKIEVYNNNSAVTKSYTRGVTSYDVLAGNYHIWITNTATSVSVRYGIKPAEVVLYDIPKAQETSASGSAGDLNIPTGKALNAFLIQGSANTSGYAKMTIKGDLKISYNQTTLPVSLTSFTGKNEANGIRLNWKTASELNNDHFDVLRSTDGKSFNTLTSITGNGTSNQVNTYSYLDNAPETGTNYYQLNQVDKDGTATKSNIIAVSNSLSEEQAFTLSVVGNTLNASFDASANGTASITIHDLSGRSVFTKSVATQKGANSLSVSVPSFDAGIYVATITQNGKSKSVKFVK